MTHHQGLPAWIVCRIVAAMVFASALHAFMGCGPSSATPNGSSSMDDLAKMTDSPSTKDSQDRAATSKNNSDQQTLIKITLDDVRRILAPREVEVEILGVNTPTEIVAIQKSLDESTKANAVWFQGYIKANSRERTGKALPYHEKFGISEDEYMRLLEFYKSYRFVPVAKGHLKFTAQSESKLRIESVERLREFDGVVVDFESDHVVTDWGIIPVDDPIHTSDRTPLGSWNGYSWKLDSGSLDSGTLTMLEFAVGRQVETQLNVIHLSAKVLKNGVKTANINTVIRFP